MALRIVRGDLRSGSVQGTPLGLVTMALARRPHLRDVHREQRPQGCPEGTARPPVNRLVLALKRWWNSDRDDEYGPIVPASEVIDNRRWLEEAS